MDVYQRTNDKEEKGVKGGKLGKKATAEVTTGPKNNWQREDRRRLEKNRGSNLRESYITKKDRLVGGGGEGQRKTAKGGIIRIRISTCACRNGRNQSIQDGEKNKRKCPEKEAK